MSWLNELLWGESIAHSVLLITVVALVGVFIGNIKFKGVGLGIAGVLFSGLLFGHFGFKLSSHVFEFAREFGLILFVYTIGIQVGPGFVESLKRQGLSLNLLAMSIVLLGATITLAIVYIVGIDMKVAVGMFAGATTNTPALAAAQQALKGIPNITDEALKLPGLGYAVAYPFGVIGIIITMWIIKCIFRIDIKKEGEKFAKLSHGTAGKIESKSLVIENPNIDGVEVAKLSELVGSNVVVSRIYRDAKLFVAQPTSKISKGDVILAVAPAEVLERLKIIIGRAAEIDLKKLPGPVLSKRIIVTKKSVLGKTIDELSLFSDLDIVISRITRSEVEFLPNPDYRFQFGDVINVVGEDKDIQKVSQGLGDSPKELNHPQVAPLFLGIALGVFVGSIPIYIPGIPAAVKLGLAGGPLLVAIILSRINRIGPLIWHMPASANFILRELGIILFLSCVGLKSGDQFVATLVYGHGLQWMAWSAVITLIPIILVGLFARLVMKVNFLSICGLLAGSMTDPPALAFANSIANGDAPSVAYATVYPMTMVLRILSAQLLVLLFLK